MLMAFYPDIQQKLIDELQTVFLTVDEEVRDDHLNQLVYMELIIKESLRFWPIIPHVDRSLYEDMKLGKLHNYLRSGLNANFWFLLIGDYIIPKGSNLVIPILHIHRNKRFWGEDADEFKPERFETESYKKMHPYAYLPFSKGSRICIGYKYAERSLKVTLAHFFRCFTVSTTMKLSDVVFEYMFSSKIAQGYNVSLQPRSFLSKSNKT
jgi:cytochrome P450